MPDPSLSYPLSISQLTRAIGARVIDVTGDSIILAQRSGDKITLKLSLDALLPRIPRGQFPVTLSNASGSAGTNSPPAAATYVYDVADAQSGNSIKTGVSVWMARQKGHITAASKGFAQYIQGTLYIVALDEVLDTTTC